MYLFLPAVMLAIASCGKGDVIEPGNDPNFTIVANEDEGFNAFNRKVEVFQIPIYAKKKVDDGRLLHAANVMAQYLDNDEDGQIDNELLHSEMLANGAYMFMWANQSNLLFAGLPDTGTGQDLGNDETRYEWHINGYEGRFDAALEEVFHIISHAGYSSLYPEVFGEYAGTELCDAMDVARGGYFLEIPSAYPEEGWYHYDDQTCDYGCMATEYLYWGLTSLLGAQTNRADEIGHEWELHSPELMSSTDTLLTSLLQNEEYKFPTVLPDGTYMR